MWKNNMSKPAVHKKDLINSSQDMCTLVQSVSGELCVLHHIFHKWFTFQTLFRLAGLLIYYVNYLNGIKQQLFTLKMIFSFISLSSRNNEYFKNTWIFLQTKLNDARWVTKGAEAHREAVICTHRLLFIRSKQNISIKKWKNVAFWSIHMAIAYCPLLKKVISLNKNPLFQNGIF